MITTELNRCDIAIKSSSRVYQSSTVDNLDAALAVTPHSEVYMNTG